MLLFYDGISLRSFNNWLNKLPGRLVCPVSCNAIVRFHKFHGFVDTCRGLFYLLNFAIMEN